MLKKLLFAMMALLAATGFAFADVDVNKGDQAALDGIKGIGPAKSKAIIDERTKNGSFKDWADFENRVKGIGDKNSSKMSEAGLTVNGQAKPGTTAKAADAASKPAKAAKADKATAPVAASTPAPASAAASASAASKASASTKDVKTK